MCNLYAVAKGQQAIRELTAHSGDRERPIRSIVNTGSGDHEHPIALA
jgi:aspartate carbamoyltransferase catalytic subunit